MRFLGIDINLSLIPSDEELEEIAEELQQQEYEDVLFVAYVTESDEEAQRYDAKEHRHWRGRK